MNSLQANPIYPDLFPLINFFVTAKAIDRIIIERNDRASDVYVNDAKVKRLEKLREEIAYILSGGDKKTSTIMDLISLVDSFKSSKTVGNFF
jgi:hypothetical protein